MLALVPMNGLISKTCSVSDVMKFCSAASATIPNI